SLAELSQSALKPQSWSWQGSLDYLAGKLLVKGLAKAQSGLTLSQELEYASGQPLRLDWRATDLFLLAGNPLAATLAQWPERAELTSGRMAIQGRLISATKTDNEKTWLEVRLGFKDVAGLYDRSLFEGLNGSLSLTQEGDYWILDSDGLSAGRVNHGIEIAPVHFAGTYVAPADRFRDGMVSIARL